jgi:hypothetical protein
MQSNRSARSPRPVSVCSFTFADGRQCRLPRRQGHPYRCLFHEKKEAQILAGEQAGQDIANLLSGNYISACDVARSLARLFSAVAQGHIKPKTAATLAYLGQTLVQTLKLAQDEYINAFGTPAWRQTIASNFPPRPIPTTPISASPRPAAPPAPPPRSPSPTTPRPPFAQPASPTPTSQQPSPSATVPQTPAPLIVRHPTLVARPSGCPPDPQSPNQPAAPPAPTTLPNPNPASAPQSNQTPDRSDDDQCGITTNGTQTIGRLRGF